jgi:hypothetical protein
MPLSSEEGHFITWTQAQIKKQFVEKNYMQIGLSIPDITIV